MLIFGFAVIIYSDFVYARSGVVLFDEIPLHEIRLLAPAIFLLLFATLANVWLSKGPLRA